MPVFEDKKETNGQMGKVSWEYDLQNMDPFF